MTDQENTVPLVGAHMSIAGGMEKAFARGEAVGCTAIQIFTKNANRWHAPSIEPAAAERFRTAWKESSIRKVAAHDSYLINLAAPDDDKWKRACAAFLDEMVRCSQLGVPALVMHPGAHLGTGEEAGLKRIATAFRSIFAEAPQDVTVLLENTAAQGSYLGGRFEHLSEIMDRVPQGRFGLCFDTCHAYAAGHDIATLEGYAAVMAHIDQLVGVEAIQLFHVNDSKKGLGSHFDRHEHVGEGAIGPEGFRALMQDERFSQVPKILETPKGENDEYDRRNLALLRSFVKER